MSPPSDGAWRSWSGADLTDGEVEAGERLGRSIDPDDDEDNGGVP